MAVASRLRMPERICRLHEPVIRSAEARVDQRLPTVKPNSRCASPGQAALSTSAQYRSGLSRNRSLERDSEMLKHLVKFQVRAAQLRDERGATAVEYGLMVALIASSSSPRSSPLATTSARCSTAPLTPSDRRSTPDRRAQRKETTMNPMGIGGLARPTVWVRGSAVDSAFAESTAGPLPRSTP